MITKKIIAVICVGAMLAGCNTEKEPTIRPADPSSQTSDASVSGTFTGKYARFAKGEVFEGKNTTEWNDTLWQGERASQQIMLTTGLTSVSGLSYEVSDICCGENMIPAANVRLRFVDYVLGDAQALICGQQNNRAEIMIGDALTDKEVTSFGSDDPLKLWVTVDVPRDVVPGQYSGSFTVKQDGKLLKRFSMNFMIVAHALPQPKDWSFNLDLWQFPFQGAKLCSIKPFTSEYYDFIKPFYALLADAGQKAATVYIKDGAFSLGQTMIEWKYTAQGSWQFDYKNFDSYVEFMQSLGIDRQINCFSMAGWMRSIGYTDEATGSYKYKSVTIGSSDYNEIWDAFLTDFRAHLLQKGWFDKTVIYMDENTREEMDQIIKLIHANSPDWKIGLAGRDLDVANEREIYDYSTIIGYNRSSTNNPVATFYTSCSQTHPNNYVSTETDPAEMTWLAWHAMAKGFNGYTRWAFDYWTNTDPFDARDGSNTAGDFSMIYRSSNNIDAKPVSSIRFELLREGIQDYEKVRLLGAVKMRDVLTLFADPQAPDAKNAVLTAQARLKQQSLK